MREALKENGPLGFFRKKKTQTNCETLLEPHRFIVRRFEFIYVFYLHSGYFRFFFVCAIDDQINKTDRSTNEGVVDDDDAKGAHYTNMCVLNRDECRIKRYTLR